MYLLINDEGSCREAKGVAFTAAQEALSLFFIHLPKKSKRQSN